MRVSCSLDSVHHRAARIAAPMEPFSNVPREAVSAANECVAREIERAIAAGRAGRFMGDGRYFERTSEGVFEIAWEDHEWVRISENARCIPPPQRPERDVPVGRGSGVRTSDTEIGAVIERSSKDRAPSMCAAIIYTYRQCCGTTLPVKRRNAWRRINELTTRAAFAGMRRRHRTAVGVSTR
jgi:hypothetical protein